MEGIQSDPRQIVKNPGLVALAELMLNSFWDKYTKRKNKRMPLFFINLSFLILGNFSQRTNMTKVKIISDPTEYIDLLSSDQINVTDANFINDELIEVHYENVDEFVEADGKTNVVIAAFITAYARLNLYSVLDLYFDADSVIYVSKDGEWEPPTGSCPGELTDELDGGHQCITTLYSCRTVGEIMQGSTCLL